MSAYSEWKYGLISDAEYNSLCRQEEYEDRLQEDWDEDDIFEEDDLDDFD